MLVYLIAFLRRLSKPRPQPRPPMSPEMRTVRTHHVLSGRLMDAPTRRIFPSDRHRVPPWVEDVSAAPQRAEDVSAAPQRASGLGGREQLP